MKYFNLLCVLFALFSCREKRQETFSDSPKVQQCKDALPDSLFFYKNGISSSEEINNYEWSWDRFYPNRPDSISYKELNYVEKLKFLPKALHRDPYWLKNDIRAWYVSKQKRIDCIQPIIIEATGTDFAAQALIVLDENGNYVSGMYLNGGENSGPLLENDSITVLRPITKCFFERNIIRSYVLRISAKSDHKSKTVPAIVDSVRYMHEIGSSGVITTKRIDSVRYRRIYRW